MRFSCRNLLFLVDLLCMIIHVIYMYGHLCNMITIQNILYISYIIYLYIFLYFCIYFI